MIKGINLTMMIGPGVPLPAPRLVLDALQSVRVISESGDAQSGFDLNFSIEKNSPLISLFMLAGGSAIPFFRVRLIATINGRAETLIDGVATQTQIASGSGGGPATLSVQGKDLSAAMDVLPFDGLPYPAMPPVARVLLILAKYAFLGVLPKTIPSLEEPPIPTDRIPRHEGSDLRYVRALAEEAGYIFRMEPGPAPGTSFAYWGPEIRFGTPQPALTIDSGHANTVESLSFRFDKEGTEIPLVFIHNRLTGVPIPIPIPADIPFLPPLGAVPPIPPKVVPLDNTAQLSPVQALVRGFGYAARHSKAVQGSGTLDVLRYGRLLRAGAPVGVRGAGYAFDGLHYVERVTSNLARESFKQEFSLTRNGLFPTVASVAA
ncbi:hypothetical protein [Bradyrhizobium sp. USDA 3458]|uniref:hypothetical protein n=1 Tax=Bradyrhizobium sp. USDA 3458 TaxID=2591461 RepID=UPI001144692B|nr:hypothetical protein [Bradyrhizobium sp. USDA 3458]